MIMGLPLLLVQIFASIAMSASGMLLVAWYNGYTSPWTGPFNFKVFWQENGIPFIYSMFGICLLISIVGLAPDVTGWIKTLTGFEIKVPITNGGAVIMGAIVYDQVRKKFRQNSQQTNT